MNKISILSNIINSLCPFIMGFSLSNVIELNKKMDRNTIDLSSTLIKMHTGIFEDIDAQVFGDCVCGSEEEMTYGKGNYSCFVNCETLVVAEIYNSKKDLIKKGLSACKIDFENILNIQRATYKEVSEFIANNNHLNNKLKNYDENSQFIKITYISYKNEKQVLFLGDYINKKVRVALQDMPKPFYGMRFHQLFSVMYHIFMNGNRVSDGDVKNENENIA